VRGLPKIRVFAVPALGAAILLFAFGCSPHPAAPPAPAVKAVAIGAGDWYLFRNGTLSGIEEPAAGAADYRPWTVQTHEAGFLQIGGTLYVALNGWGVLALPSPSAPLSSIVPFESRPLFDGRTINGIYNDSGSVLVHLYRNLLFRTPSPATAPIAAVKLNLKSGMLETVPLASSTDGWEAVDVVHAPTGQWVIAWKKIANDRAQFKYRAVSPTGGRESVLTRKGFLDAYDFQDITSAPDALRAIAALLEAQHPAAPVLHLLVHRAGYSRVERYRLGSEERLASGDANLLSVPVFETPSAFFALSDGGSVFASLRAGAKASKPIALRLPDLPAGFVFTDLWADGRTLVASWEQQRFPDVGAAGLFVADIARFGFAAVPTEAGGRNNAGR